MKCVLLKNSGAIVRIPNDTAAALVKKGSASYAKKSSWKIFRDILLSEKK